MKTNNSKEKVRQLQNKLYLTAKKCDSRRFHALYDKVYRDDVLFEAWKRVKANKGSSGVDGIGIEDIEEMGIEKYLSEIKSEIADMTKQIGEFRKEVKLCDGIIKRSNIMKDKIESVRQEKEERMNEHIRRSR